jgi:hypothetical protein
MRPQCKQHPVPPDIQPFETSRPPDIKASRLGSRSPESVSPENRRKVKGGLDFIAKLTLFLAQAVRPSTLQIALHLLNSMTFNQNPTKSNTKLGNFVFEGVN